ncbi:MAG: S4 domain-containing protein [Steroidobacteraceae bacterium]
MAESRTGERLQKLLAGAGLGSRREVENWIRAGRLSVNGQPATLGMRARAGDDIRLDGRLIRSHAGRPTVFLCHRSPGESLREPREGEERAALAERLPSRAGKRFIAVSPMPQMDGGLEILSSDGTLAAQLQRIVRRLPVEFRLRLRGQLDEQQIAAILQGELDSGQRLRVLECESAGGEGANRWYRVLTVGANGKELRQLFERQAATVGRVLRVSLGTLLLERDLPRGRARALKPEEIELLMKPPTAGSDVPDAD